MDKEVREKIIKGVSTAARNYRESLDTKDGIMRIARESILWGRMRMAESFCNWTTHEVIDLIGVTRELRALCEKDVMSALG